MIKQTIHIKAYDWLVYCYFDTSSDNANEILSLINDIGINDEQFHKAEKHLLNTNSNSGLTYTNTDKHTSVVVVSQTTSPAETLNTFTHELRHLVDDIALVANIPNKGEEIAYLTGNIALKLASNLLDVACHCPICSHKN